jgi:hypothetical protein
LVRDLLLAKATTRGDNKGQVRTDTRYIRLRMVKIEAAGSTWLSLIQATTLRSSVRSTIVPSSSRITI